MAKPTTAPTSTRSPYVDWSRFTNGGWWELTKGTDFVQDATQAARAARQWASVNGYRCNAHTQDDGKALRIRFVKVVVSP